MLSRSKGVAQHSHVLGFHADAQSRQAALCPHLRRNGRCASYEKERAFREAIAREKEAELKKKATGMYTLQLDLLADMEHTSAEEEEEDAELKKMRQLLLGSAEGGNAERGPSRAAKAAAIDKLIQELKQEPEYVHWNLEAAVAERMVEQQVRPCKYSHRAEVLQSLKRSRAISGAEQAVLSEQQRQEEMLDLQQHLQGARGGGGGGDGVDAGAAARQSSHGKAPPPPSRGESRTSRRRAVFAEERKRVFGGMTPLQRCVVAMMWQGHMRLPQHVRCADVRLQVEREVEAEMLAKAGEATADVESALETYMESAAFEARVKAAESAVVDQTVFLPALGVLDLASLPQLVSYLSKHALHNATGRRTGTSTGKNQAGSEMASQPPLTETTLTYFGSSCAQLFTAASAANSTKTKQVVLTEKEVDISSAPRAAELVEAIEWALHVYNTERRLGSSREPEMAARTSEGVGEVATHVKLSYRAGPVKLRSLSLRNCQMTLADGVVASLHKTGLGESLLAVDLSDNRLHSLRFLFLLRAHFAERLLRLSLRNNLITRKPEYQEQVRKSLPRLTSLDGEPIRRPPLRFPKPHASSCTVLSLGPDSKPSPSPDHALSHAEYDLVMDTVARFFYIWETRRIPHTELEKKAFLRDGRRAQGGGGGGGDREGGHAPHSGDDVEEAEALLPVEEELNEDNFPHRYLHPSATFTFTASPGTAFFNADTMKLDREVEFDDAFTGLRLNAHDMKDARVFDVAVRNSSRNLLMGRPALQRLGRGSDNCYVAYQYSLYPERLEVDHGLAGAVVSVTKLPLTTAHSMDSAGRKGLGTGCVGGVPAGRRPGSGGAAAKESCLYMVSLHGVMTWRLPSMRNTQCFRAAYDRTMVFTEKMLAAQNYAWERRRSPKLVLCNDQVLLRPLESAETSSPVHAHAPLSDSVGQGAVLFSSATASRMVRLIVQFGLEACRDGETFVRAVMERTTSDAAEEAALDALVFGPEPEPHPAESRPADEAVGAALRAVFARHVGQSPTKGSQRSSGKISGGKSVKEGARETAYCIFSLLDRTTGETEQLASGGGPSLLGPRSSRWGGSTLHEVPLSLLVDVTKTLNELYELDAFKQNRERGSTASQQ